MGKFNQEEIKNDKLIKAFNEVLNSKNELKILQLQNLLFKGEIGEKISIMFGAPYLYPRISMEKALIMINDFNERMFPVVPKMIPVFFIKDGYFAEYIEGGKDELILHLIEENDELKISWMINNKFQIFSKDGSTKTVDDIDALKLNFDSGIGAECDRFCQNNTRSIKIPTEDIVNALGTGNRNIIFFPAISRTYENQFTYIINPTNTLGNTIDDENYDTFTLCPPC